MCEVEVFGTLKLPPKVKAPGDLFVYVADNDCLAPDAHILGRTGSGPEGRMFIEVFTKWGADITICGALEEPGKPARYYGKAEGKFHAEGEGEVMFRDVVVNLKAGPPRKFPQPGAPVPAGPG
jgi:hypothetical protein